MSLNNLPEALFVDIIGTVVNWRSIVTNCLSTAAKIALSPSSPTSTTIPVAVRTQAEKTNWRNIAEEWHDSYVSFTRTYTVPNPSSSSSSSPSSSPSSSSYTNFDDHMLPALTTILEAHNLAGLFDPDEISSYARIWHFLDPYPDSVSGISALKKIIPGGVYALSNGNASLLADMAAWNKIDYSGIFSAEEFKEYAPSTTVYEGVAGKVQVGVD
ncbi:hypothetical protein MMC31_004651, partial [Peltigera leucophlebia]|nr:hypothetical protein [Peltigera leucophlebia]